MSRITIIRSGHYQEILDLPACSAMVGYCSTAFGLTFGGTMCNLNLLSLMLQRKRGR